MFNNITWQGYWTTLALLSAGYYLVIYALFYRNDFKVLIPSRKEAQPLRSFPTTKDQSISEIENDEIFSSPTEGDEAAVYACMDELNAFFEESKRSKWVKEELLYAVQRILSKHPLLKDSSFKDSINNVIVSEAKQHCSIQLSSEDMVYVWLEG